jgi:hypothetical protein
MRRVLVVASMLLAGFVLLLGAGRAQAATGQETLFQDDGAMLTDPAGTIARLKELGVDRVRLAVRWLSIAPRATSGRRPAGFKAIDPGAYPAQNWAPWDHIVREAANQGVDLDFDLMGGSPLWATGPGAPKNSAQNNWMPSAKEYGAFVHAIGVRYSGNYDPKTDRVSPGNPDDLPAVRFWSIWNEPDYGPSLAPQGAPHNVKVERAPWMYRGLLDAAWTSLHRTGHGHDTILFGEIAPRGFPNPQEPHLSWGIFSGMKPLTFLRALYCVDTRYRPLRGTAAALRGCPTTRAASRRFRSAHPGLFQATGFADHPYSRWYPPNVERDNDPEYTSLADIGNLERGLDRLNRVYGSHTRFPIWNTEYGYITSPPKHSPDPKNKVPYIAQNTAAYFMNWAEYISWRNSRLMSFDQYLLADPEPATRDNDYGGFASGLLTYARREKATYSAFRLPVFLPKTTASSGQSLEVWGCARPSGFVTTDTGEVQTVTIQLQPASGGAFKSVETIPITNTRGYFDVRVVFPSSGTVRLMWSYPPMDPFTPPASVYSRLVQVNVH